MISKKKREKTTDLTEKNVSQEKEPFIYGYKALDENLCASAGNGMQFEVGETYEVEGELEFCKNGFHFCKNLEDTLKYYTPKKDLRFVKIEAYGEVLSDGGYIKQLCRKIKIVKELSNKDIVKVLNLNEKTSSREDVLKKDFVLRLLLAYKGSFLNMLFNDEDFLVRAAVAEQGYGLDTLINDENPYIRCAVANQGYGLDVLINDKALDVRAAVAEQGYGLDILINDRSWYVRLVVAEQGYGLEILIDDEDWVVRDAARRQLSKLKD